MISASTRGRELETVDFLMAHIDKFGTRRTYNHYAVGWAHAMNTPYQWTKQIASHWGGTRNGTIVHWPKGVTCEGRDQESVLPCASTSRRPSSKRPASRSQCRVHGVTQAPIEGSSMVIPSMMQRWRNGTRRNTLRCSGTAASTTKGWSAVTKHQYALGAHRWCASARVSTTTSGSSTMATKDWTQAQRPLKRRCQTSSP